MAEVPEGELSWKAQLGFWLIHRLLDAQRIVQAWTYRELDRARLERDRFKTSPRPETTP